MLEKIKLLLGISDTSKDELLTILIDINSRKLQAAIGGSIPTSLEYIIIELTIKRYNLLGSEGLAAESVEGISRTYNVTNDDLEPYRNDINRYLNASSGKFRFR